MNDRVSAAPPRDFLGPDDVASYERQFYARGFYPSRPGVQQQQQQQPAPRSNRTVDHQSSVAKKSSAGFFAPLWDGVREKLHLTRSRSSGSIEGKDKMAGPEEQQKQHVSSSQPSSAVRPSRDEVMESYKNLVSAGFFDAHAIQSTRRPLRPRSNIAPPKSQASDANQSFLEHMKHLPAQTRSTCPPAPTSTATTATSQQAFAHRDPPSSRPSAEVHASPHRGTKRGAADIAGGAADTETSARKLVKKLRKSASRISADLSAAATSSRSRPSTSSAALPSFVTTAGKELPPVPPSLPGNHRPGSGASARLAISGEPPRHSVSTMRAFSSSYKTAKTAASPNKLTKVVKKKELHGRTRRRPSTSGSGKKSPARGGSSGGLASADPRRPASPRSAVLARKLSETFILSTSTTDLHQSGRPDTATAASASAWEAPAVPSFHYPQRVRPRRVGSAASLAAQQQQQGQQPLGVIATPNAAAPVPSVPRIPNQFAKGGFVSAGAAPSSGALPPNVGVCTDVENRRAWRRGGTWYDE